MVLYKNQCKVYWIEPTERNCINTFDLYVIEMFCVRCNPPHVLEYIVKPCDLFYSVRKLIINIFLSMYRSLIINLLTSPLKCLVKKILDSLKFL